MPLNTLYGEAAGLLRGAAQTAVAGREIKEKRADRAADVARTGLQVVGGLAERQMQNDAQLIDITEPLANGAAKVTGDESWKQMVGKKIRADVYSGMLTHSLKEGISRKYTTKEVTDGDKTYTILLNEVDGTQIPLGTPGKGKKKAGVGGMSATDKEFIKTFRQYQKDTEGFNYEMAKGLSATDPKQSEDLTEKLDFLTDGEERFNKLQGTPAKPKEAPPAGAGAALPPAAMSALKGKIGQVVTFKNGQSWMMNQDGKVERVR